ncbi:N,N-dimethylformamidase beta subunit family domain-containing protein [Nocardia pneumoniae]|uniref:N,N-dimethylformamidase beta subunit family domain-containing protein n=1 Tax=Nocardia pneumoniae TaxID=228601 RepID=UPI0002D90507|nr:N,N-dimethylformamidase beta subunit family domain-containing protein [Nocardia pneumoniae]
MKVLGYSKQLSAHPGEQIDFAVSCETPTYHADIVKLIHGDTNPDGPGEKIEPVATHVDADFPGRIQRVHSGSHVMVPHHRRLDLTIEWTLQTLVFPTTPERGIQGLITKWDGASDAGVGLFIGEDGSTQLWVGNGAGNTQRLSAGAPLISGLWYLVTGSRTADGTLTVSQVPVVTPTNSRFAVASSFASTTAIVSEYSSLVPVSTDMALVIAGQVDHIADTGRIIVGNHFNGKIDRPRVHSIALSPLEAEGQIENPRDPGLIAAWNFDTEITPEGIKQPRRITDVSRHGLHGTAVNMPTRAVTGYNWQAKEQNFIHAPSEYGAIHFHDDDLADAEWDIDFTLTVPEGLPSGLYAARLVADNDVDYVPFYVKAEVGNEKKICFLAPTASYMAYANDHVSLSAPLAQLFVARTPVLEQNNIVLSEHREFGLSTYDQHTDGSGVAYSTRQRPILNMRPGFRHWLSPSLWQFNADLHLIDWLTELGYEFDVLTDEDLQLQGVDAIAPYRVVLTGSHPEYYSEQMLDAIHQYTAEGGRLMYLGANGFYWVINFDPEDPSVIEVRKGNGSNAWKCKPGEYHLSFTGEYGTLWRHRGRAPQRLVGVGFGSEGFDVSSYFRRVADGLGGAADWMFDGIGRHERIGDFGLVGDGAAGLELDIYDASLGTPPETVIGATSEGHTDVYLEVAEELYFNVPGTGGTQNGRVRGDITYFPTQGGGGVWSCSSIAYCGSLSHNNYDNNVSRLTRNVLDRFLQDGPAPAGASEAPEPTTNSAS